MFKGNWWRNPIYVFLSALISPYLFLYLFYKNVKAEIEGR